MLQPHVHDDSAGATNVSLPNRPTANMPPLNEAISAHYPILLEQNSVYVATDQTQLDKKRNINFEESEDGWSVLKQRKSDDAHGLSTVSDVLDSLIKKSSGFLMTGENLDTDLPPRHRSTADSFHSRASLDTRLFTYHSLVHPDGDSFPHDKEQKIEQQENCRRRSHEHNLRRHMPFSLDGAWDGSEHQAQVHGDFSDDLVHQYNQTCPWITQVTGYSLERKSYHEQEQGLNLTEKENEKQKPATQISYHLTKKDLKACIPSVTKTPLQLMDIAVEIRMNIWDRLFEDEAFTFKPIRYANPQRWTDIILQEPHSWQALLINKQCYKEIDMQIYKSVRLELDLSRMKSTATREFLENLPSHRLAQRCERIFFLKQFGLHKMNLGIFTSAKEVVSTHWVIEGDKKMSEYDYEHNLVDPQFVLRGPTSQPALKDLKERRFWFDHLQAALRYQRRCEGWCAPVPTYKDSKLPFHKGRKREFASPEGFGPCLFNGLCMNLEKIKFCMMVKYTFKCDKARSQYKEVWYDFYPAQGDETEINWYGQRVPVGRLEKISTPNPVFYDPTAHYDEEWNEPIDWKHLSIISL